MALSSDASELGSAGRPSRGQWSVLYSASRRITYPLTRAGRDPFVRNSVVANGPSEQWAPMNTRGDEKMSALGQDGTDGPQTELPVLTVGFSSVGSVCLLTVSGELNGTSIAALEAQIDQIGCSECHDIVLDVAGLLTVDSVGMRVLIGLDHYVRALGARLTVTGASGSVAEALAPTRLGRPVAHPSFLAESIPSQGKEDDQEGNNPWSSR